MGQTPWINLYGCDILAMTDKAVCFRWSGEPDPRKVFWFPKASMLQAGAIIVGDKAVVVTVSNYIAKLKGIRINS